MVELSRSLYACRAAALFFFAMKTVEKWKWRIRWAGRWVTTRIAMTEQDIRREHPEATKVDNTRIEVTLPESEAEVLAYQRPPKRHTSGSGSQGNP
jgi:hypothetical protein